MKGAIKNLRTEQSISNVGEWFEQKLYNDLNDYLVSVEKSPLEEYDFRVRTVGEEADIRYEVQDLEEYTEIYFEVSGADLTVDSALSAFNELWQEKNT